MGWTENQIISRISSALNDTATAIWGTATIAAQLDLDVRFMSEYTPQLAQATIAFAGTARELSIASLTDSLGIEYVEFPIDKHPRRYVNFSVRGSSVIMDNYLPSVSSTDTAYIWYAAPHTVSGTATNTLNKWQEGIVVDLTAAHLLQNIARDKREVANFGGGDIDTKYMEDGLRKEQQVMSRLMAHVTPNISVRYPDVK